MLGHLLPGLRQLRTPFASGVLWLVFGWLVLQGHITHSNDPALFNAIDSLGHALKPLGIGFSITLGAYLVGALFEAAWTPLYRLLPSLSANGKRSIYRLVTNRLDALPDQEIFVLAACRSYTARSLVGVNALLGAAGDPGSRPSEGMSWDRSWERSGPPEYVQTDTSPADAPEFHSRIRDLLIRDLISGVEEELDVIGTRLLGSNKDLFNIYDRLQAEAEFRTAVAIPTAGALTAGLVDLLPWPLVCIIVVAVLMLFFVETRAKKMAAGDRIVDALRINATTAPSLEDLKPKVYTVAAIEETRLRVPANESPGAQLYRILGVPWRVRVWGGFVTVLGSGVELALLPAHGVRRGVRKAASWFGAGRRRVGATSRRLGMAAGRCVTTSAFILNDFRLTRGAVVRERHRIRAEPISEHDRLIETAMLYRRYGYYDPATEIYEALGSDGLEGLTECAEESLAEANAMMRIGALQELMDSFIAAEDDERAERVCRKAIARGVNAAHVLLGDLMQIRGEPARAEREYRIAGHAGVARGWEKLGDLYVALGQSEQAQEAYAHAVRGGSVRSNEKLTALRRSEERTTGGAAEAPRSPSGAVRSE